MSDPQIAKRVWKSTHTIKTHMLHARWKLAAQNRTHAVAIALRRGLID